MMKTHEPCGIVVFSGSLCQFLCYFAQFRVLKQDIKLSNGSMHFIDTIAYKALHREYLHNSCVA